MWVSLTGYVGLGYTTTPQRISALKSQALPAASTSAQWTSPFDRSPLNTSFQNMRKIYLAKVMMAL
jgi:hypothetical protein